jgi:hypothetical protein
MMAETQRTILLRCTAKVLTLLRIPKATLVERPPSIDDWYANLMWIEGRKCLLFTHAGTLFSVFVPDVRVRDLTHLGPYVAGHIERELEREGLPADTFWPSGSAPWALAETVDRSIVGCMTDMAFACEVAVNAAGGLKDCDSVAINHRLHRHIVGSREFTFPIDATRSLVQGAPPTPHRG